jgi:O-6-methylguanine DNA methyltransferase
MKTCEQSFGSRVIEAMKHIPRGRVTTYKAIAHSLGCKAYRAVGNAVGANPYAPVVPCHRVVKSDGTVGNYGSGVRRKIELLNKEGIRIYGNSRSAKVLDFEKVLFRFK